MGTIIVSLVLLLLGNADAASVVVGVREGWLQGQTVLSSTGRLFCSFKGIPFAEAPLGGLRFKAPQPPLQWQGIRDATNHGSICLQLDESGEIKGNEDCLFLNVYTPKLDPFEPLPVIFFIHGGSFKKGSGSDEYLAPDFLMDCGVVVVTINYRLDVFGFLSVNSEEAPGNAGLKDQVAALQWVQENIRNFGGDPDSVTIMGQSAGASSVTLHMLSPASRGLFHRAIAMSGVYSKDFGMAFMPEKRAFVLGRKLGFTTSNANNLIRYLQNVPAEDLMCVQPHILFVEQETTSLVTAEYFTPVVEKKFGKGIGQFLTESPVSLMEKRQVNRVDLLIGHTEMEGLKEATVIADQIGYFSDYKEFLVPTKISYCRSPLQVLEIADEIKNYYFGAQAVDLKTFKNFVNYHSAARFVYELHAFIERLPKPRSERRYFYEFDIYSERNKESKVGAEKFGIKKATHKDDLGYLFDGRGFNTTLDLNGQIYRYIRLMTGMFTNFAKFGTPTPDESLGLLWPEYDPDKSYMRIGKTGDLSTGTLSYANSSLGFWYQLYERAGIPL